MSTARKLDVTVHNADSSSKSVKLPGIELPLPERWSSAFTIMVTFLSLCLLLGWITYLFAFQMTPHERQALMDRFGGNFVVSPDGDFTRQKVYQISFWSPGEDTQNTWVSTDTGGTEIASWMRVNEEKVVAFGTYLREQLGEKNLNGYRRYPVVGHGRTDFKSGWWWTVSVAETVDRNEIIQIFRRYWRTPDQYRMYTEIVMSESGYGSVSAKD